MAPGALPDNSHPNDQKRRLDAQEAGVGKAEELAMDWWGLG